MGRGGWMKTVAFLLAVITASCGGTGGGGSSGSGNPLVFQTRGRLNLIAQVVNQSALNGTSVDPTVLTIIATLLDPQGNPFRNQRVTFEAEFPDATIVPGNTPQNAAASLACLPQLSNGNATRCTNRGASITDDFGQAQVTLIAGLTLGRMRLTAEAPANLNISSAISVTITNQGFIGGTDLAILPTSATFVNPQVSSNGQSVTFGAVGGTPPYEWDNTNDSLGEITPGGIPNINQQATYTLTGPIPTDTSGVLTDTVILTDARGTRVTATITVIFADCQLKADGTTIDFPAAVGGEQFRIDVGDGVPPFTVTDTFPGTLASAVTTCNPNCTILFTLVNPAPSVDPDTILIRDARGCTAKVELTVVPHCGNGTIEASLGEECDGSALGGRTCANFPPTTTGSLVCSSSCEFDTSGCTTPAAP